MKWIEQEQSNTTDGDCFRACLASITELEGIPNYIADPDRWWPLYDIWLRDHGWTIVTKPPTWSPGIADPCIAVIRSPTLQGYDHAVVWFADRPIWDPSPSRNDRPRALGRPKYFVAVERLVVEEAAA